MIFPLLLAMLAGWIQRHQQQVLTYLLVTRHIISTTRRHYESPSPHGEQAIELQCTAHLTYAGTLALSYPYGAAAVIPTR